MSPEQRFADVTAPSGGPARRHAHVERPADQPLRFGAVNLRSGSSPRFPLLFEHELAVGVVRGRQIEVPTLPTTGALLVARGADQLIVPAPSAQERDHVEAGIAALPAERRHLVRVVDEDGAVLRRVRGYLEPLGRQATKWPETAFVDFAESFLYQLALASTNRAGIADDSVSVVRGFVPIIDPGAFSGEARFRLAELVAVLCSYEPAAPEHVAWTLEVAREGAARSIWEIFDSSEFHAVVAASGKLGLVRHPKVLLQRIRSLLEALVDHPRAKPLMRLGSTAADLAGAPPGAAEALSVVIEATAVEAPAGTDYWPPFIGLGPAQLGVYRAALRAASPEASPLPGTVMSFRGTREGREGMSWLNVGEEGKLEREAALGLAPRMEELRKARDVQSRFAPLG
jgi:hypothetical protein